MHSEGTIMHSEKAGDCSNPDQNSHERTADMSKEPLANVASDQMNAKEDIKAGSSFAAAGTCASNPCIMGKYQGRYTNRRGGIRKR